MLDSLYVKAALSARRRPAGTQGSSAQVSIYYFLLLQPPSLDHILYHD